MLWMLWPDCFLFYFLDYCIYRVQTETATSEPVHSDLQFDLKPLPLV